jgi:flagellar hook-associated protein FlgK
MARLGIYVAQHALNVTGNNISNINTKGYTRENLDQSSMYFGGADRYQSRYDIRENGGVLAKGVDQMRDQYLDIRYRNEMTRVGESDMKLDGLKQLDVILDEVADGEDGEGVLEARFNDFIQQLEQLSKDSNTGKDDIDGIVRSSAEALAVQFNSYSKRLEELMANEAAKFKQEVAATNTTLEKIRDLNETIRKTQIFGGSGLTLKDERNVLIDELSEKIGINVIYEMEDLGDGIEVEKLKITTSGDPRRTLIDGIYGAQLSVVQEEGEAPKLDENGHPLLDANGNYIMEKRYVDSKNFDLAISELVDARGKADPSKPNELEKIFELTYVEGTKKTDDPSFDVGEEWAAIGNSVQRLNLTAEQAKQYQDQLNEQYGYTAGTAPYFHVSQDEFKDAVTGQIKEGFEQTYVVHFHNYDKDGATAEEVEKRFSYVNTKDAMVTKLKDTELTGGLQAMREMLTESGEYTTANRSSLADENSADFDPLHYDPDAGTKRGIPYYQKALDNLANTFAKLINEANTLYKGGEDGYIDVNTLCKKDANGKFIGADGAQLTDEQLADYNNYVLKDEFKKYFKRNNAGEFLDADGNVTSNLKELVPNESFKELCGGALFSNNGNGNDTTGITAGNISVANDWAHGRNHVLRTKDPEAKKEDGSDNKSRAQDNTRHLITLMGSKHVFENEGTGTKFEGTFQEMLTDVIAGTLAKDENITQTMLSNYNTTADEIYVDRDAVMGVDLNDEAMNMMQFQKAYSAACRLMTTYDSMLEKLINGMAI